MQAARLQIFAQELAEGEAARAIGVVVGDEKSVAGEPIAEMIFLSLVLPGLEQMIRHRIVMDGNEQIGVHVVGALRSLDQTAPTAPWR